MARVDIDEPEATVETDATEATENTENTENVATEATEGTEAADVQAESAEAPAEAQAAPEQPEQAGPTEEEIKAAVDGFVSTVEEVVGDTSGARDEATGTLTTELVGKVKTAFSKLPAGKARKAAKDYLNDKMKACMDAALSGGAMDPSLFSKARSYLQLHEEATSVAKTAPTVAKPQLSPTEQLIQRALPVYLAPSAIEVPTDGVDANWQQQLQEKAASLQEQVVAYYQYLAEVAKLPEDAENKPEEPEVDDAVKQAFRIARGRAVGGTRRAAGTKAASGPRAPGSPRGDVGRHILNAFADKAPGTFLTVAEIVNTQSTDAGYAPGDKPSPGAVAARLFKDGAPHTTLAGIEPGYEVPGDPSSKKGARKA